MTLRPALTSVSAAGLGCLLLAPVALASGSESTPLNLPADTGGHAAAAAAGASSGGGLVRTIVGLAVVIGVIYGLYWVLKQIRAAKEDKASGQGLAPLATLPLGGSRSLQLVRAGKEIVLLGVGEAGVTPIRTYSQEEATALGLLSSAAADDAPVPARLGDGGDPFAARPTFRGALVRGVDDLRRRTVIRK
jgi:flagellar protein FliO/FliZ